MTVGELLSSPFATQQLRDHRSMQSDRIADDDSVASFLEHTQFMADNPRGFGSETTNRALRLVHAVYRAYDPIAKWKVAAKVLAQRGFSEEQIKLVRTDFEVRKALRKLLRPYHR